MNSPFNNFNLVKKPLIVNEAGLMIYLYTNYLAAKNKSFFSFEESYPGFTYTKDLNLTSMDNAFHNKTYTDFMRQVKKESLPYLEDFFHDQNEDILHLFYLFSENDMNYFPFLAGIFQNTNVFDLKDFTYELFENLFDLHFITFMGVDLDEPNFNDAKSIREYIHKAFQVDFLSLMNSLPYDDKLSMALIRSYSNKKTIYDRLYPLLEKICQILENNFYRIEDIFLDHFDSIKKDNYQRINKLIDQVGIRDLLAKRTKPLDIYGLIIAPNTTMFQFFTDNSNYTFIKFGIFSDKKVDKEQNQLKLLSQYLKILGDPTRIDILDLLKEKNYYAKELSDKLNITPATLSYHISQLQMCGFIGAYIEGRKTYYYLRRPGFEKVIEELTEFSKNIKEQNNGKES